MTDVLFLQGAGAGVHDEWDIRLVESLRRELGPSWRVHYPPLPDEADPSEATWRPAIEQALADLGPGSVVVGHSAGGTMLLHVLAESGIPTNLAAIALVAAPFFGKRGWEGDGFPSLDDLRLPPSLPVFLYHGEDDATVPVAHVERLAAVIPHAHVRRLAGRDHQLNDDMSEVARDLRNLPRR